MSISGQGSTSITITGAPVTGTGAAGQLTLWDSSTTITGKTTFLWDLTNGIDAPNMFDNVGRLDSFTGALAGRSLTTGSNNTGGGHSALGSLTTGSDNTGYGESALSSVTTTNSNTGVGSSALKDIRTTCSANTALGALAGRWSGTGTTNGTYIGYNAGVTSASGFAGSGITMVGANSEQTVDALSDASTLGAGVTLSGSHRIVLGSGTVTDVFCGSESALAVVRGKTANMNTIPVFADNATAITGGLVAGDLYRTGSDPDPVCVVH